MERKIKYKGKNRILVLSGDYFWREIKRKQATSINIQYISQLHNQKLRIKVKASFKSKIQCKKPLYTPKNPTDFILFILLLLTPYSGITLGQCLGDYMRCWGSNLGWHCANQKLYPLYYCFGTTTIIFSLNSFS